MSEQADLSDNYIRTVLYSYHHKRIRTSDGCTERLVAKFVDSNFFGSSFASKKQELDQMEEKIHSMEQALKARNSQLLLEKLYLLKQAEAGKVDYEEYRKWKIMDIVQSYITKKQKDEVHKLEEDYENLKEELISPLEPPPATTSSMYCLTVTDSGFTGSMEFSDD